MAIRRRRRRTCAFGVHDEARCLARFVTRGIEPADRVRALITITPTDEMVLRKGLPTAFVEQLVQYRAEILAEFDKLLADASRVDLSRRRVSSSGRNCPQLPENRNELTHAL
jgi:hypothetical protein